MHLFCLLQREKDGPPDNLWIASLQGWKTNAHWAVNWVAMRALAHFRRHDLLGRQRDLQAAQGWLAYVLEAQKPDGGIEDVTFNYASTDSPDFVPVATAAE